MVAEDVLKLVCEALEIPDGSLAPETNVGDVEEWDSIGWLTIMSMLDEQFGVQVSSQEIRNVKKVGDFVRLVLEKKGS